MVDEALRLQGTETVKLLLLPGRTQSDDGHHLRLSPAEKRRAVCPRQESHLGTYRPDFIEGASIQALSHQSAAPDLGFGHGLKNSQNIICRIGFTQAIYQLPF
ncbi:hypothetical protein ES703_42574 [subsurface metagenome]